MSVNTTVRVPCQAMPPLIAKAHNNYICYWQGDDVLDPLHGVHDEECGDPQDITILSHSINDDIVHYFKHFAESLLWANLQCCLT